MALAQIAKASNRESVIRDLATDNLETFQKYRILSAVGQKLKNILINYVCVGNNLFSTTSVEEAIEIEPKQAFFGRRFLLVFKRVSDFQLEHLSQMKMEEHPVALSFINSIIKTQMRNSKLCQIGRNPRFFMPS